MHLPPPIPPPRQPSVSPDFSPGFLAFLLLLFLPFIVRAQQPLSFAKIDSLSYKAYLDSDWKKVLEYSKTGFQSGYDYYYLRMRAGIAELNLNKPIKAESHFRKALTFNHNDPNALEYLYASLLKSGDFAESRLLAYTYSPAFRKRLGIPSRRLITSAFVESGYMVNPKADSLKSFQPDAELAHIYYIPSYWYIAAGINLQTGKRFSATLATNLISYTAIQQFTLRTQPALVFDVPYDQRAVYAAASYYLGKGFHITLGTQAINYTLPLYSRIPGENGSTYLADGYAYSDYALNASLVKRFPYVTLGVSADANRFKNTWYKQLGVDLTLYPAGNVNTWLRVNSNFLTDSLNPAGRIITQFAAGRKLFRNVWIEGNYYLGDIRNFSEQNGYVVFNNIDLISKRLGVSILAYQISPHLDLSLRYQYTLRSASWQIYKNSEYIGDLQKDYPVHSFIGGLTWRF